MGVSILERAKKGLYGGGVCPFGYKRINKKLIIEPKEAEIVRRIFDIYIETASWFKTYNRLKAKRILNRKSKPFTKGQLFNLLRKVLYIGKITHNGEIFDGLHAPIISSEQFEQAQGAAFSLFLPNTFHGCPSTGSGQAN